MQNSLPEKLHTVPIETSSQSLFDEASSPCKIFQNSYFSEHLLELLLTFFTCNKIFEDRFRRVAHSDNMIRLESEDSHLECH